MAQRMDVDQAEYDGKVRYYNPANIEPSGPPEIDPSEIERGNILGDGSFGSVYAGRCRQKDVAVKVLLRQDFDKKTLDAFRHEVGLVSKIFHPNINLFMGACTQPGNLIIVTELMKGDLETLLLDHTVQVNLFTRMKMARDAALGMLWLHSSNPQIIHRDLKASNLLFDENYNCKICDFGLSQLKPRGINLMDGRDGAKGTPLWMAPEVMMGEPFNEKCDVYAFGLILWFFLTRKEPYEEYNDLQTFTNAICAKGVRPPIPSDCHPSLRDLMTRCWDKRPSHRPSFSEIVSCLDHIIIDCGIEDPLGRQFWRKYFLKKHIVGWNEFINAFADFLELAPRHCELPMSDILKYMPEILNGTTIAFDIRCLKSVLVDSPKPGSGFTEHGEEEQVNIEKFGNILQSFGPLTLRPFPPEGVSILEYIKNLLKEPWFHGDTSTTDSEVKLISKPEGTYLIRFSTSTPGSYTISKVSIHDGTIKHQKIIHKAGGPYEINGRQYKSLQALVKAEAMHLHLFTACQGSRFTSLFVEQRVSGYIN